MTKTAIATNDAWDIDSKTCLIHNCKLTYSRKHKQWYCKECLYASFLTQQAQQNAAKRYSQSEKGRASERRYELSDKGKVSRERYLKSDKYKQRRREYNQRLKESLQIARLALAEKATKEKVEERQRTDELMPLIQDIREYADTMGMSPSPAEVTKWARDAYGLSLPTPRAIELIHKAAARR